MGIHQTTVHDDRKSDGNPSESLDTITGLAADKKIPPRCDNGAVPWFPAHELLEVGDDEPCALGRALDAGQVADALGERCECEACAGWRREQVGFDPSLPTT
jgi:hypothetical protein